MSLRDSKAAGAEAAYAAFSAAGAACAKGSLGPHVERMLHFSSHTEECQ